MKDDWKSGSYMAAALQSLEEGFNPGQENCRRLGNLARHAAQDTTYINNIMEVVSLDPMSYHDGYSCLQV